MSSYLNCENCGNTETCEIEDLEDFIGVPLSLIHISEPTRHA